MSDGDKIRLQFQLDIAAYGEQVSLDALTLITRPHDTWHSTLRTHRLRMAFHAEHSSTSPLITRTRHVSTQHSAVAFPCHLTVIRWFGVVVLLLPVYYGS